MATPRASFTSAHRSVRPSLLSPPRQRQESEQGERVTLQRREDVQYLTTRRAGTIGAREPIAANAREHGPERRVLVGRQGVRAHGLRELVDPDARVRLRGPPLLALGVAEHRAEHREDAIRHVRRRRERGVHSGNVAARHVRHLPRAELGAMIVRSMPSYCVRVLGRFPFARRSAR
jgi:hypothetical protein